MNVEHALNNFYNQHGYGVEGGTDKKWDMIKFGPLALPLPNLESRRKNIYLHDISRLPIHTLHEGNQPVGRSVGFDWQGPRPAGRSFDIRGSADRANA